MKKFIYQIYYNQDSFNKILPGFIPLDNSDNLRPDWFEFWVILNFLRSNVLEDDAWYGFLSPKFYEKTGYHSDFVLQTISQFENTANVALFSPGWDQLSYYINPFEQGEVWHPGLIKASQEFIDHYQIGINLQTLVSDTSTSVFSNYIIATKDFWYKWKDLAEKFFDHVENNPKFQITTSYGSIQNQYPMKTFIQERLATLVLTKGIFKVLSPDQSLTKPIFTKLFPDNVDTRRMLQTCDLMKSKFLEKKNPEYLDMYWKIRGDISYSKIQF